MSAATPLICHECWDLATGHAMPCKHVIEAVNAALALGKGRERIDRLREMQAMADQYADKLKRLSDAYDRVQKASPVTLTVKQAAAFDELVAAIRDLLS